MTVPHSSSCFVHIHHPVIWFIRLNEEVVGFSMDNQELFDAQWYRIPRALFTEAAKVVRDRRLLRYGREEEICECDTGIRRCAARVRSAGGREELPDCTSNAGSNHNTRPTMVNKDASTHSGAMPVPHPNVPDAPYCKETHIHLQCLLKPQTRPKNCEWSRRNKQRSYAYATSLGPKRSKRASKTNTFNAGSNHNTSPRVVNEDAETNKGAMPAL